MKPEKVEAVLIYADGPVFTADVVYRRGDGFAQIGATVPLPSHEAAENSLRETIAEVKSMTDHPIVISFREQGIDPERVHCLRVSTRDQTKYVICWEDWLKHWVDGDQCPDSSELPALLEFSRMFVLEHHGEHTDDLGFIKSCETDTPDSTPYMLAKTASLLLANGVINIDSRELYHSVRTTLEPTADPDVWEATMDLSELVKPDDPAKAA